jgi:hypothetical protein
MSVKTSLLAAFAALGVACSTPSVPLPPPDVDISALSFMSAGTGEVTLSQQPVNVFAGDEYYIISQKTGDGVVLKAAADGSFTSPEIAANVGDTVAVFFIEADGTQSTTACITVLIQQPLESNICQ